MLAWLRSLLPPLNPAFAASAPLRQTRFVVVDTELTSLERKTNRLLSIGAIAMQGTSIRLGEEFYRIVNPSEEVPVESVLVHGLRPADIAAGEIPSTVVRDFHAFAENAVLVGHFVGIDINALRKELQESFPNPFLDTARAFHWLQLQSERLRGVNDVGEQLSLAALAGRYELELGEAHHALGDAFTTAQLWQKLLGELEQKGISKLGEALKIARG